MYNGDEVKAIAYHIWEEEGQPSGRDIDHWLKAEAIWNEQQEFLDHIKQDVGDCGGCAT